MAEPKTGLIKGFREFVMRGNVIDLAVAVVVGAAFGAVVKSFTDEIIAPVIAAVGGADTGGWGFCVDGADPCTADTATFLDFGAVLGAIISFLITMAVVYFVFVAPMNKARSLMPAPEEEVQEEAQEEAAEVALLTEIRDLLAEGRTLSDRTEQS
jgi:large conductance mechanosensitive channel